MTYGLDPAFKAGHVDVSTSRKLSENWQQLYVWGLFYSKSVSSVVQSDSTPGTASILVFSSRVAITTSPVATHLMYLKTTVGHCGMHENMIW